ncbi:uncharacterized protein LOC120010172 [Tripterygium wilfordii]|uniref:uncharacterized protein LOC120010172 n=1 Tax=Tripterygium wilfordii TaxID=458696 RepID=UPI0018F8081B|nr:uncharacterized protein LOC120010172 [Tripterygium wilfordii]
MNSPTPSPTTQAIQDWQFRLHDHVYGLVKSFEGEGGIFDSQRDLIVINHTVIGYSIVTEELVQDVIRGLGDSDERIEVEEVQAGKFEVIKVVKDELIEEQARVVCEDACDFQMDTIEIPNVKSENVEVEGGQIEEDILELLRFMIIRLRDLILQLISSLILKMKTLKKVLLN